MKTSEKINLDVDTTEANRKIDAIDNKIEATGEKLEKMVDGVDKKTQDSFNEVMGMMRASYMMMSGLSQAFGGNMSDIFSSMFSIAISGIQTFSAIAAAMAHVPGAQFQAITMSISLATAISSLIATMSGQTELARQISGFNMALQGIGGMISNINFI